MCSFDFLQDVHRTRVKDHDILIRRDRGKFRPFRIVGNLIDEMSMLIRDLLLRFEWNSSLGENMEILTTSSQLIGFLLNINRIKSFACCNLLAYFRSCLRIDSFRVHSLPLSHSHYSLGIVSPSNVHDRMLKQVMFFLDKNFPISVRPHFNSTLAISSRYQIPIRCVLSTGNLIQKVRVDERLAGLFQVSENNAMLNAIRHVAFIRRDTDRGSLASESIRVRGVEFQETQGLGCFDHLYLYIY